MEIYKIAPHSFIISLFLIYCIVVILVVIVLFGTHLIQRGISLSDLIQFCLELWYKLFTIRTSKLHTTHHTPHKVQVSEQVNIQWHGWIAFVSTYVQGML
jgi:hypothetical protein